MGPCTHGVAILVVLVLMSSVPSRGHVEEECFLPNGTLTNLYQTADALDCEYGDTSPKCLLAAVAGGSATFATTSPCRGFIHFDALFFTAQAVGFTGEIAYWIAAFAQATDFVQFVPVDSCGNNPLAQEYWTPPMRGFLRTSTLTGQPIRHLGLLYRGVSGGENAGASGLDPDLNNSYQEGDLVHVRNWAFNNSQLLCTLGIREPTGGNYYNGSACISSSIFLDMTTPNAVGGPIPTQAVNATLGDQVMHYDCVGDSTCANPPFTLTNVRYAYQLDDYLANSSFAKLTNGQPVPGVVARFGAYLHQLADRASHYYCTGPTDTGILGPRVSDGAFFLSWNTTACQWVYHSIQHYWEQSVAPILAPQSWSALNEYYDELTAWAAKFKPTHPEWFNSNAVLLSKAVVVGNSTSPGILAQLAMDNNVVDRVEKFMWYLSLYGYSQVPGQETACPSWPQYCTGASAGATVRPNSLYGYLQSLVSS